MLFWLITDFYWPKGVLPVSAPSCIEIPWISQKRESSLRGGLVSL